MPVLVGRVLRGGLVVAAVATAWPLLARVAPAPVAARQAVSLPLDGAWRTYANGDRVLGLAPDGDEVWLATDGGGVVKWNRVSGAQRQYLAPQDGLESNNVHDVVVDRTGTVWAATDGGLARYDATADLFTNIAPANSAGMPARVTTALEPDPDGTLWVGFAQEWDHVAVEPITKQPGTFKPGGLARYDPVSDEWKESYHVELTGHWTDPRFKTVTSENIAVLEMASDGTLWIGTIPYMVFDINTCTDSDCPQEAGYWVPAGGGLVAKQGDQWQNWYPAEGKDGSCYSTIVRDLAADTGGKMWVAAGNDLLLMRNGLEKPGCDGQVRYEKARLKSPGMRGQIVWSVDVGADGRVWTGQGETIEKGLGIGVLDYNGTLDDFGQWDSDDYWEFIDIDGRPGSSDVVPAVLRLDPSGVVLVGTRDHKHGDGDGLRVYRPTEATWQRMRTADGGLPSNQIADVQRNHVTGDLWVATENHGVSRFDGERWQTYRMFQAGDDVAVTTVDARKGASSIPTDLADAATFNRLFPPESSYVRFGDDPTLYRVIGFTIAQKSIRIAPGLLYPASAGTAVRSVDRGPASNSASQIAIDEAGNVWVGGRETVWQGNCPTWPYCWLDGGVGKWDGSRWTVYNFEQTATSLPVRDGEVQSMAVDTRGRVWAGTGNPFEGQDGKGIFVYDPAAKTYSLFNVETIKSRFFAGDGVADIDRDPQSGDMWTAHHTTEVCSNNGPFGGGCSPSFAGGGVSRWNGTEWQKWSKRAGAFLKGYGAEGDMASIAVDRSNGRVWAGGFEAGPAFHWLAGIDVDAVINWCPLTACTNDAWKHMVWPDDGKVVAIEMDDTGNVWVGTHRYGYGIVPPIGGVKLFDGTDWHVYTTENSGLPSNEVTTLSRDGDTMWAGTLRNGVARYLPVPPPTETPAVTNTPRPTTSPTPVLTDEPTPTTAGPTATLRPGETAPTPTATPTRLVPTATTPPPGSCGNGGPCHLYLPFGYQRRACRPTCPTLPPPRTVAPSATSSLPSATMTAPPTETTPPATSPATPETAAPTDEATQTPDTPSATVPPGVTPSATSTARTATPTRTTRPTLTATTAPSATATTTAPKQWAQHAGQVPRDAYYSVTGIDATHVWMVGANSRILFWDGQQLVPQRESLAAGLTLRRVHMYNATRGYVIGDGSSVYETRNGGELWRRTGVENYTDNWRAIAVGRSDSGYVGWLLGNLNGNRLMWTGTDWTPQSPGDRNNRSHSYSDVAVVSGTLAHAISDAATGARFYTWDGTAWTPGPSTSALYDMDVLSRTEGVAVGRGGALWRLDADGVWVRGDGPRTGGQDLYAVHMLAADHIWVAGARGKIYEWDGTAWTDRSPTQVRALRSLWMTADGAEGWAVGDDGVFLHYR